MGLGYLPSHADVIPSEEEESVPSANKRFHYLSKVRDHFWNRWRREYLTDLREYHRGKCESQVRTVSIGDVVIVFEENVTRGLWKIGKVEEVIRGSGERGKGESDDQRQTSSP